MTQRPPTVLVAMVVPVVAAVTAVVTLATTSGSEGPTPDGDTPAISIENFEFGPDPLEVEPGSTITVFNRDDATHTVTSEEDGGFDTGDLDGRGTTTIEAGDAGTYPYFCAIHEYMEGTVEVSG
jgi:plastocyanin